MNSLILAALSIFGLNPYGEHKHLPDELAPDAFETTTFKAAAAKGEIESLSWLVRSEKPVQALDIRLSSLKDPDGAEIPVDALDLMVVKVWFQPEGAWTDSRAGNIDKPVPQPGPLFHDDAMVRVDWEKKVNYLRIDYATGPVYCRMSGKDLTDPLNHSVHPIRDAKSYVPCALEAGRLKQFWLTVKTPKDAKPGTYRGTVELVPDGGAATKLELAYTVHPFSLPTPRTHYDPSRRYVIGVENDVKVQCFLAQSHDLKQAELKAYNTYRMMAEHNVLDPSGPGWIAAESPDCMPYRTLYWMQKAGLPLENLDAVDGLGPCDPESVKKRAKTLHEVFGKYCAPGYKAYFVGADEADESTCRYQYDKWSALQGQGCRIHSAMAKYSCGWCLDSCQTPAYLGREHARTWHHLGATVATYSSPFTGPDCPDIWRRTKGLRFYYADFDGLDEYCFYYHARNRWNEFIPSPDTYRSFGWVYPCIDGMIGTLALEGVREGIDDVRYLSLLRLRALAAIRSGDGEKALEGRRQIAWMDSRDPEYVVSLDDFRLQLAERIVKMIALVGPEPEPKPLRPMPAPGPTTLDRLAADGSRPVLERADACRDGGRWDLAVPLYEQARKDGSLEAGNRVRAMREEVTLRLARLDRNGAMEAIGYVEKSQEIPVKMKSALDAYMMDTMLTPVQFREKFTPKVLADAEAFLKRLIARGVPASVRYTQSYKLAKALLNSDDPLAACRYDDRFAKANGFTKAQCGNLLYCTVEAWRRTDPQARARDIYAALKRVSEYGGCDINGEARNICGEAGVMAESLGELDAAQQFYAKSMSAWPSNNDKWYPLWRASLKRVTDKISKSPTKISSKIKAEDDLISLDE